MACWKRLDAAVQRIRQFTSDMLDRVAAQPLALIRGTAELALRRERAPEEYRDSLGLIVREAEQMTGLTESLLTLARADGGGLQITLAPVDLRGWRRRSWSCNAARAEAQGVALRAQTGLLPAKAQADAEAMRRVLIILVDNALKHTAAGGRVTVSAEGAELRVE